MPKRLQPLRARTIAGLLSALAGLACLSLAGSATAQTPAAPTADEVQTWIAELDSGKFDVRELATQKLQSSGLPAVAPAARAARGDEPEVTHRAVLVLRELCQSDDAETATAAQAALTSLVASKHPLAAQRAQAALKSQRWLTQRKAIAAIRKLGGTVYELPSGDGLAFAQIVLGKAWTGGDEGLAHLASLTPVFQLSLHGRQFTDAGVEQLEQLTYVGSLQLYGTSITDEGETRLRAALVGTFVDRRQGALLGISGGTHERGCEVYLVQPNSAADDAGLEVGDVIVAIDDQPTKDFASLTGIIARKDAGDEVRVKYLHDDETFERQVTLGELEVQP